MVEINYNKYDGSDPEFSQTKIIIITVLLSFVLFISMTGQGIVIPVFPLYVEVFGGGAFELGLLIAVYSLTSLVLSPIIGAWADKYGRKIFILLGLLGFAIANVLYTTATSFNELLFYRIIEGSTAAGTGAIVNALLIDIIPANKRAKYLGIANGSGFLGIIVGPVLGGFLVSDTNLSLPFLVSAIVALIGMVIAYAILPNDYQEFKDKNESKPVFQIPLKQKIDFRPWLITGASLVFVITILIRFSGLMSWTLIQPAVPIFLYAQKYTPFQVGVFFGFFGIAMFLGQIFFGSLSDKYGRKIIIQIGVAFYFFGFLSIINTTNLYFFYLAGVLNGIGLSLIVPAIVALLADLTREPVHRGKVMAIYYNAFFLAGFVGPLLGGYLDTIITFQSIVTISIAIILIQFTLSFFIKVPTGDYEKEVYGTPNEDKYKYDAPLAD